MMKHGRLLRTLEIFKRIQCTGECSQVTEVFYDNLTQFKPISLASCYTLGYTVILSCVKLKTFLHSKYNIALARAWAGKQQSIPENIQTSYTEGFGVSHSILVLFNTFFSLRVPFQFVLLYCRRVQALSLSRIARLSGERDLESVAMHYLLPYPDPRMKVKLESRRAQ